MIHAGLHIIGRQGYQLLIDQGIDKAKYFASLIAADTEFELISKPELNILTYRLTPHPINAERARLTATESLRVNSLLNQLTILIQKTQRQRGKTFVSRTLLKPATYDQQPIAVFRVVLANPLTTKEILQQVLQEQKAIAQEFEAQAIIDEILDVFNTSPAVFTS